MEESACDACLRRAFLVARLAPRIAGLLDRPRAADSRHPGSLGVRSAGGGRRPSAPSRSRSTSSSFDPDAERERLGRAQVLALCRHAAELSSVRCASSTTRPRLCSRPGAMGRSSSCAPSRRSRSSAHATRAPTAPRWRASLGRGLGAAGVPVVSGLALGIDATAHRGCLEGGGAAFAVLACGPDVAYPRRHRRLHEQRSRERPRAVRAAARHASVSLELSGPQPDHGRVGSPDGGRRGRRPERQPDHRGLRARPRSLRGGGARAG